MAQILQLFRIIKPAFSIGALMTMKKIEQPEKIWQWCPVCMSNQYFEERDGKLCCANRKHKYRLMWRQDEWVKNLPEWKASQKTY
jgi:hypothetical protein